MGPLVVIPLRGESVVISPKPHIRAQRDGRPLELNVGHPRTVGAGDEFVAPYNADEPVQRRERLCGMISKGAEVDTCVMNVPGRGRSPQQISIAFNGSMLATSIGRRTGAAIAGETGKTTEGKGVS